MTSKPALQIRITAYQVASYTSALIATALLADGLIQIVSPGYSFVWLARGAAFLAAVFSMFAALAFHRLSSKALLFQAVSCGMCTSLLIFSANASFHIIHLTLVVASVFVLAGMLLKMKARPIWVILTLAIFLAGASFYIQRMGPSVGQYGTECPDQPGGACLGPLLGAGFPFQYVLDQPGVSIIGELWLEDRILPHLFLADVAIYAVVLWLGMAVVNRIRVRSNPNG